MNYLLDKKIKRKKNFFLALAVVLVITIFYFRSGVFNGLSYVGQTVFRPVLVIGNNIGSKFSSLHSYFLSKQSLFLNNENLKLDLDEAKARMLNYDTLLSENSSLKEILGRKNNKINMVLGSILAKPNQSPYDTLLIDAGAQEGIKIGDTVFALGNIPIGRVELVYANSSKVVLFSSSKEKTQVVVSHVTAGQASKDIFMTLVGRGGGNFEMILPRDFAITKGDQVALPGLTPYIVALVETMVSDPRDSFEKALLVSPVNIQELKFVQIEI